MDSAAEARRAVAAITHRSEHDITPSMRLSEDLGIRSANRVEIAAMLEESLGVVLTDRDVLGARTVADLAAALQEATPR